MSKKITHEQARESIEMVDGSFSPTEKEALLTYIKQNEKLLELYKEALETNFEGITLIKLVNKTLRTQIKEKENE